MKKLILSLFATSLLASAVFAAPELTDENKAALTEALSAQGYAVEEITVDGDNYSVVAVKDDQKMVLTISEAFELVDAQPAS